MQRAAAAAAPSSAAVAPLQEPRPTSPRKVALAAAKAKQREEVELRAAQAMPPKVTLKLKMPDAPVQPAALRPVPERSAAQQAAIDAALASVLAPPPPPTSPRAAAAHQAAQAWMTLEPGATPPGALTTQSLRLQIMKDLHHLFNATLRVYAPEVATQAAAAAAAAEGERPPPARALKLRRMSAEAKVLRDAKHFVTECAGGRPGEGVQPPPGTVRAWVKLSTPPELSAPPLSTTR
jgi:hypothetical protein